jgi:hypothetical protein
MILEHRMLRVQKLVIGAASGTSEHQVVADETPKLSSSLGAKSSDATNVVDNGSSPPSLCRAECMLGSSGQPGTLWSG